MSRYVKTIGTLLCLVVFLTYASPVVAQREATNATFSGAVQLPGVLLPAGSYSFSRTSDGRNVVVSDADHRVIATLMVIPITRSKAGAVITLRPSVAGAAPEVSAFYSDGGTAGVAFVHRGEHLHGTPLFDRPLGSDMERVSIFKPTMARGSQRFGLRLPATNNDLSEVAISLY
jgi:hypothetical protein